MVDDGAVTRPGGPVDTATLTEAEASQKTGELTEQTGS